MGKLEKYTSYKDSEVDWIGEIPEHWTITKLKYLGTSTIGLTYNPNNLCNKEEGTLVLRSSNIQNGKLTFDDYVYVKSNIPKKLFIKENDILICSRNGSRELIGKCAIAKKEDERHSFGAFTTVFRSKLNSYLFQILNSEIFKKQSGKFLTSTINQLTVGNLNSFEIPLPPKEEQIKIASFLNEKTTQIDEVISQKEKLIELLKERKQIVINDAVTKGLDKNVEFVDSGVEWIGEIPKHWKIEKLKSYCKAYGRIGFRGYTTSDLVNENEGAITISPSNIFEYSMKFEKCSFLSWEKYYESPEIQIEENDILIVKTGSTFGKIGMVKNLPEKATINPQLLVLKNIKIQKRFFYYILISTIIQTQINKQVVGSTIPTISENKILNFISLLPPKEEQLQIAKYIENQTSKIDKAIELQQNYISKLKEYKASLIDSVVTGKVRVA